MRLRLLGVVVSVTTLLGALAMTPAGAHQRSFVSGAVAQPDSAGRALVAHLRLHIVTTSDQASVSLGPGTIVASRVRGHHGSGHWQTQTAGYALTDAGLSGTKKLTVDLVYQDLADSNHVNVIMEKGDHGLLHVGVTRVADHRDIKVGTFSDRRSSTAATANVRTLSLSRGRVLGNHSAALPHRDPRRLVLAFYYPWYHRAYAQDQLADRPKQRRSTYSARGVNAMTAQAKANGVNGFIVSWAGQRWDGKQFRLALKAAQRQHQKITGYVESLHARRTLFNGASGELQMLVQLLRYSKHSSFLKTASGVPIVFVYQMDQFSPAQWHGILSELHSRYHLSVKLVGDDFQSGYLPYEWGLHRYSATQSILSLLIYAVTNGLEAKAIDELFPRRPRKLFAATVSPGYDDQRLRGAVDPVVPRAGGRRYKRSWQAAIDGQPDWVLITSWNEWYEDTEIEPGKTTGSRALRLTRVEARRWRQSSS